MTGRRARRGKGRQLYTPKMQGAMPGGTRGDSCMPLKSKELGRTYKSHFYTYKRSLCMYKDHLYTYSGRRRACTSNPCRCRIGLRMDKSHPHCAYRRRLRTHRTQPRQVMPTTKTLSALKKHALHARAAPLLPFPLFGDRYIWRWWSQDELC